MPRQIFYVMSQKNTMSYKTTYDIPAKGCVQKTFKDSIILFMTFPPNNTLAPKCTSPLEPIMYYLLGGLPVSPASLEI